MARVEESVESRGAQLYETKIREETRLVAKGDFVVIDIYSEDYEVDSDDATATMRLLQRHPGAMTWAVRVGFDSPYHIRGGRLARIE